MTLTWFASWSSFALLKAWITNCHEMIFLNLRGWFWYYHSKWNSRSINILLQNFQQLHYIFSKFQGWYYYAPITYTSWMRNEPNVHVIEPSSNNYIIFSPSSKDDIITHQLHTQAGWEMNQMCMSLSLPPKWHMCKFTV